jgi:subtilisin family serine protease
VRRSWGVPVGLTALMVMLGGSVSPAVAARHVGQPAGPRPASAGPGGLSVTEVTLITGDRVRVTTRPGGRQSAVVEPRYARSGVTYDERTIPGPGHGRDLLIVPSDAAGLVGSGVLDESLFHVSKLVRDGYTAALPLIFTYRQRNAPDYAPTGHGMGAITRALPSIDGAAVREATASAKQFWASLTRPSAGGRGPLALAPQVAKVWLDARVSAVGVAAATEPTTVTRAAAGAGPASPATPAFSAARASVPRYTGKGVLVADLDTGYDAANPDLKGVVSAATDFTGSADGVQDKNGHGTWTASIVAGSGAESGGRYPGVATGARLLIGKVLGDDGSGTESQVIAGMQWAAAQHAKVVNLSLGFLDPVICENGTDPVSQAVESLSAAHGTLFVVPTTRASLKRSAPSSSRPPRAPSPST